jgi:hypothetical protein
VQQVCQVHLSDNGRNYENNLFALDNLRAVVDNKPGFSLTLCVRKIMLAVMEKVRVVLVVEEEIRDALRLEATLQRKDMADILTDFVTSNFPDSLAQIRKRRAAREKKQKE